MTPSGSGPGLSHWRPDPVAFEPTTVGGILRTAAASTPDAPALVEGSGDPAARRRWSYLDLWRDAARAADALAARFAPGERVAVSALSRPESLILTYAAGLAGLVLVPANPALRAAELTHVLGQSGAAGLFVGDGEGDGRAAVVARIRPELPALREVVAFERWDEFCGGGPASGDQASGDPAPGDPASGDPAPGDIAQLVYTSGTTGAPKGALLTHGGMTNAARLGAERFGIRPDDVYVDTMPLYHVGGQVVPFSVCQRGGTVVLPRRFDPAVVLDLLETEGGTLTCGVPTMLLALIDHPDFPRRDLSRLRAVSSGGAVVPTELIAHIEASLGVQTAVVFGQTEACGFISQTALDDRAEDKAGTLGRPLPGVEARVVRHEPDGTQGHGAGPAGDAADGGPDGWIERRDRRTVVPVGEVGELEVRARNVMVGYHELPGETAAALDPEGWLATGDLVTMDDRGFLRIVGRVKDMIVSGGENIYPAEVEAVLGSHPDIGLAAVVGVPDPRWGERPVGVVSAAAGRACDPAELERWLRDRLAPYKVPRRWLVVDEFPMTASGKIQKFALRDRILSDGSL